MKIKTEDLADRQVQLTVEIPDDRLQAAMRSTARRLSRETRIPGFRPGKAPFNIILSKFGEDVVFQEMLDELGQVVYREALDQSELEPYGPGSLEEIVNRDPLTLRYTVPLPPEVELIDYRDLRIPYAVPEVDDEEVEAAMENLRQRQALIEPTDRPAEESDVVVVDIRAELRDPPEEMEPLLLDTKGVELLVEEESDWPVPGIHNHLLNLEAGGEQKFDYTFPDDHPTEEIRGQTADFHLICLEVKSRFVPEWTDDLAQNLGDYNDLLDLRIKVRENLDEQKVRASDSEYAKQVIDAAVEGAKISFPPLLLEEEIQDLIHELEGRLRSQNLGLEDYLKIEKKAEKDLRAEFEPRAAERLKRSLVLGKVVELEAVVVDQEEISAEIDRIVAPFQDQSDDLRKAFDSPEGHRRIRLDLLSEKAINRLVRIARGELEGIEEPSDDKKDLNDAEQGNEEKE